MTLYNLVIREVYRAINHIVPFLVVKIDYFSIDFQFYDSLSDLFFWLGSVFCENSKRDTENTFKQCKFGNFCDSITVSKNF